MTLCKSDAIRLVEYAVSGTNIVPTMRNDLSSSSRCEYIFALESDKCFGRIRIFKGCFYSHRIYVSLVVHNKTTEKYCCETFKGLKKIFKIIKDAIESV